MSKIKICNNKYKIYKINHKLKTNNPFKKKYLSSKMKVTKIY